MGCGSTKEKLQTDILVLQLEKAEIQEERERLIHQLELITRKEGNKAFLSSLNKSTSSGKKSSMSVTSDSD